MSENDSDDVLIQDAARAVELDAGPEWNPIKSAEDAEYLIIALLMLIKVNDRHVHVLTEHQDGTTADVLECFEVDAGVDNHRDIVRRAITKCAATIYRRRHNDGDGQT